MRLLKLFSSHSPNGVFIAILTGAISGIAYALLIPIVMSALNVVDGGLEIEEGQEYKILGFYVSHAKFAAVFFLLCIQILILRTVSQIMLTRISLDVTTKLRQDLYKRISNAPIASLERHGSSRLIQAMTNDVQRIVFGASMIPALVIQMFTLVGLLGFLCYLSQKVFLFVMLMIVIGVITFQLPVIFGTRYMNRARLYMDDLQDGFKGLIDGAKELKLHKIKADRFIDSQLLQNERKIVDADKKGFAIIQIATNYGDMIAFFVMGIIAFVYTNYNSISTLELAGVIMVLLYITGPVAFILNVFPAVVRAKISLSRVQVLFEDLPTEDIAPPLKSVKDWKIMRLRSVCYRHHKFDTNNESSQNGFGIGPINAEIKRGKITFIVGGNGSGKSTLAKIISLHYFPESGEIAFDNILVTNESINSYRQEIACIYSDYHLFKHLHANAMDDDALSNRIELYLQRFELTGKVEFRDGQFSTLKLSDGQRRRLALLVAFLDDKALYVFDEWAADQDPHFKEIFYFEVLPSLKELGKAVVVISHDDRYFHLADEIFHMESGAIVNHGSFPACAVSP